jgi:hypothetical protein
VFGRHGRVALVATTARPRHVRRGARRVVRRHYAAVTSKRTIRHPALLRRYLRAAGLPVR